jgi:hypothetical protein
MSNRPLLVAGANVECSGGGLKRYFSGDDGDLEAVLEGGGRTGAGWEGRVEVAQVVGIWQTVGFPGGIGQGA